jgi:hypothetical protein
MPGAVFLAILPAALLAQQASIEGVTVDKSSGEPISGVHISLITGVMELFDDIAEKIEIRDHETVNKDLKKPAPAAMLR